jgi:hypothetical protein
VLRMTHDDTVSVSIFRITYRLLNKAIQGPVQYVSLPSPALGAREPSRA